MLFDEHNTRCHRVNRRICIKLQRRASCIELRQNNNESSCRSLSFLFLTYTKLSVCYIVGQIWHAVTTVGRIDALIVRLADTVAKASYTNCGTERHPSDVGECVQFDWFQRRRHDDTVLIEIGLIRRIDVRNQYDELWCRRSRIQRWSSVAESLDERCLADASCDAIQIDRIPFHWRVVGLIATNISPTIRYNLFIDYLFTSSQRKWTDPTKTNKQLSPTVHHRTTMNNQTFRHKSSQNSNSLQIQLLAVATVWNKTEKSNSYIIVLRNLQSVSIKWFLFVRVCCFVNHRWCWWCYEIKQWVLSKKWVVFVTWIARGVTQCFRIMRSNIPSTTRNCYYLILFFK